VNKGTKVIVFCQGGGWRGKTEKGCEEGGGGLRVRWEEAMV